MRKTRSDAILLNLPQAQKDKLNGWLLTLPYSKVRELIALPVPEGFSRKVSCAAISGYYKKAMPPLLENFRDERTLVAAQLSVGAAGTEDLKTATLDALRCRLFRLSLDDHSDSNELARMFRLVDKLKQDALPAPPSQPPPAVSKADLLRLLESTF